MTGGGMDQDLRASGERAVSAYLRDAYGLAGNVSTATRGVNWTLAVEDGGQAVAYVRLYRTSGRSPADVAAELAALRAVESTAALEVSRPRPDCRGCTVSEIDLPDGSRRMIAVFSRAAGRELTATTSDYRHAGAALADLHRQSGLASLAPNREILSELAAKETLAMIADRSPQVARAIGEAIGTLESLGANKVIGPVGFCHGDMRPLNMRIEGERVTFFDFDDCGRGPQLLDVAAMALWLETSQGDDAGALWRAFLAGYGVTESEPLELFVRWLVIAHQLRILQFLGNYCEIDAGLWGDVLDDAQSLVSTAARGDLRAFRPVRKVRELES
jgi:Ser/Thr protein kinase RdoA (MazF antagonist)